MLNPSYLIQSRHQIYYFRYEVHHTEHNATKREALKRERAIKRMGRLQKWGPGEG